MIRILYFCSILFILSIGFVNADTTRRYPSTDKTLTAGPYYNPATKSYFELIRYDNLLWEEAESLARGHKFKNVKGHLAVIDSPATHSFLTKKFNFNEDTWIGLRFFCDNNKLEWSTGKIHNGIKFSSWSEQALSRQHTCIAKDYAPVFIGKNTFSWDIGSALENAPKFILIEYPTKRR